MVIPLFSQDIDSTRKSIPSKAALSAFLFPGGGQFYNNQYIKGSLLTSSAIASGYFYSDNAKNYKSYTGSESSEKSNFLYQRNRYGWWIMIIYIYGLLDAIVEAHLRPFNDVMNEDLEKPIKEKEQ